MMKSFPVFLPELNEISQLLSIDEQILLNCLTKSGPNWSQLVDNGSELDAFNATKLKYSLCRTLYGRLFTYVVNRINESLKVSHRSPFDLRPISNPFRRLLV